MIKNICPNHGVLLLSKPTRFGKRFYCPIDECTVVMWNGDTSTPADYDTRHARSEAHIAIDSFWQNRKLKRAVVYKKLAEYLGLSIKKTHIGYFTYEQCQQAISFAKELLSEI